MSEAGDGPRLTKRILVVDDEEDVRSFICRILQDAGYEVESAGEGVEALERIQANRPDLVLVDLMMPGLDGWGLLRRLRDDPDAPPAVVLTARADYDAFAQGVRAGAIAYISKPFHFGDLLATCQRVLETTEQRRTTPAERRQARRRQLMVGVRVLSQERVPVALGELVDLSRAGAQVHLVLPLEVGSRVRVALHLAVTDSPLKFEGLVRWCSPVAHGFAHGLELVDVPPDVEARIADLFESSP